VNATRRLLAVVTGFLAAGCVEGPSDPGESEEVGEVSQAVEVCFDETVRGIDVSYYQGDIDWNAVAGAGYGFAITRINHSDFMDPKFDQNWAAIKEVGMLRGAYQYFEPGEDVATQAQIVIDKLGMLGPGDLPAVIDVETTSGVGPAQVEDAVGEWLQLVEAGTGKKPIIYTGKYFWQDNVGSTAFSDYLLWHAQYPNACQPPVDPPPGCSSCANIAEQWSEVAVWQYSSSGSVPGISGNVDLNVFNGNLAELTAIANGGGGSLAARVDSVEAPKTVLAGESFTVRIAATNSGSTAWDSSTRIGTTDPRDRQSAFASPSWVNPGRPAQVDGAVETGASHTFEIAFKAPDEPGAYSEHFGFVQEGVAWFADQGGPPDDAIALDIQVVAASPNGGGPGGASAGGAGAGGGNAIDEEDGCSVHGLRGDASRGFVFPTLALLGLSRIVRRRRLSPRP
jgi:lysozyme